MQLVRRSLATMLLAFGAQPEGLLSMGFLTPLEGRSLQSRRRRISTGLNLSASDRPQVLDPALVGFLAKLMQIDSIQLRTVVARFLYTLLVLPTAVSEVAVSRIIEANAAPLCSCTLRVFDDGLSCVTRVCRGTDHAAP